MRILKYIFLLIVLFAVAVSVFVATQKGDFTVTKTRLINTPGNIAFAYVNDFRNWENWLAADPDMKTTYPTVTAGKGASFSWEGSENDGSVQTAFVKENDSIAQKIDWNGLPGEMYWKFSDSAGKTKVTLKVKGKIGFMPKIYAAMKGGANKIMDDIFDKSLAALDKTLDHEINTYNVKVEGIVEKTGNYYLKQTITSSMANLPLNMRVLMDKMRSFFEKNRIPMAGKPFVLYDYFDTSKGLTKFSVCIPVREEVFTSPGSDVTAGKFASFRAVKTTLTGDYSHLKEAWDKTFAYIHANNITEADKAYLELYKVGKEDVKGPSKFVTEIYVPVKEVEVRPAATSIKPEVTEQKPDAPTVAKPVTEDITIP